MLGDFLRFCLHDGFRGLALLLLAGWAALTMVLAILAAWVWAPEGVKWVGVRVQRGLSVHVVTPAEPPPGE